MVPSSQRILRIQRIARSMRHSTMKAPIISSPWIASHICTSAVLLDESSRFCDNSRAAAASEGVSDAGCGCLLAVGTRAHQQAAETGKKCPQAALRKHTFGSHAGLTLIVLMSSLLSVTSSLIVLMSSSTACSGGQQRGQV